MPLTCGCFYDGDVEWYWFEPEDYREMPARRRRASCSSCKKLINTGSVVAEFRRARGARGEIECSMYGYDEDSVPLASYWLCEECADLWFSLFELGFCPEPDENQLDLVDEYVGMKDGGYFK